MELKHNSTEEIMVGIIILNGSQRMAVPAEHPLHREFFFIDHKKMVKKGCYTYFYYHTYQLSMLVQTINNYLRKSMTNTVTILIDRICVADFPVSEGVSLSLIEYFNKKPFWKSTLNKNTLRVNYLFSQFKEMEEIPGIIQISHFTTAEQTQKAKLEKYKPVFYCLFCQKMTSHSTSTTEIKRKIIFGSTVEQKNRQVDLLVCEQCSFGVYDALVSSTLFSS